MKINYKLLNASQFLYNRIYKYMSKYVSKLYIADLLINLINLAYNEFYF